MPTPEIRAFGKVSRSGGADFEGFAEGLHGEGDAVDLGGVAEVGEAVDGLRGGAEAAGELGGADMLADHFVQEQDLGGEAGGKFDEVLATLRG